MTDIKSYLNDGANWQAQCVLSYVRSHLDLSNDYKVLVGRYENCREQGYVFTLCKDYMQILHIAVYEHRNVDNLIIKTFRGQFVNTPRAEDLGMKDKWDYDTSFDYGKVFECGKMVIDTFKYEIKDIKDIATDAIKAYNELKNIVDNYKGTFDELFDELKGHNKDYDLFDVNFKTITASVYRDDAGNLKLGECFDVYLLTQANPFYEHISINELKRQFNID